MTGLTILSLVGNHIPGAITSSHDKLGLGRQLVERNHSVVTRRFDGTEWIVAVGEPIVQDHSVAPWYSDGSGCRQLWIKHFKTWRLMYGSQLHLLHSLLPCGVWQYPGLLILLIIDARPSYASCHVSFLLFDLVRYI
jgi:hypothetical protein